MSEHFWSKVDKSGDCWQWTDSLASEGYGRYRIGAGKVPAHRHSYELLVGPVPEGLQLDHLCRNRGCVNPAHLDPVPRHENIIRGVSFAATHLGQTQCVNGHEFTTENTYVRKGRPGRDCRECRRERSRERWRRNHGYYARGA